MRRRRPRLGLAAALTFSLALGNVAVAAPAEDDTLPKDPKARELVLSGNAKFEQQDFEGALEDFEASYKRERHPVTLGAMAQATNKLYGCRKAVPLFRELSRMVEQDSAAYEWAQEAIVYCADKMVEEDDRPPPPEFVETPEDDEDDDVLEPEGETIGADDGEERPWFKDPLAAVLVGVGAIGVGTGVGLLARAGVEEGEPAANYEKFVQQTDRVEKMRIAGAVVAGVGGALLIGGVVRWAVLGARQNARPRASAMMLDRGGGVVFSGRF